MLQRVLNSVECIVIHHSVTPDDYTVQDLRLIHLNRHYSDIGYHYVVAKDDNDKWRAFPGRPLKYSGAHCIADKTGEDMNNTSLGVCIVGTYTYRDPPPDAINECAYIVKRLCKKVKIPVNRDHIIGHSDVSYTVCPGKNTMSLLYKKLEI